MNREIKNRNYLKITRFLSGRLFRSCMAGIVILCLVIIAVPDHSSGEEAASNDTNLTDTVSNASDDTENTDLNDIDLEEIPEEDAEDLEDVPKKEDTQDLKDTSKKEDAQDLEEIPESETNKSNQKKDKATASDSKSKKEKTVSSPKTSKPQTSSLSSEKKQLDSIPQTGENDAKALAGLVGTIALGFYLFSKKLRRQLYKRQCIKTRRFSS